MYLCVKTFYVNDECLIAVLMNRICFFYSRIQGTFFLSFMILFHFV